MNIEIINVGTELLLGEIINTNATELQKVCKELGFSVYYQTVVGDNPERFKECLEIAFNRGADCVITTGGLGPTADDLTKELSAEYLGLKMEYLEEEAKKVYDKCSFVMNSKDIPNTNFKQAYFPVGCYILENEVGTANGCVMSKDQRMIINLPGPPKEFNYVLHHELVPYLKKFREDTIYTYDINTMNIGESNMAALLKDIIESQKEVSIALYASEDHCRVRLGVKASSKEIADIKMKDTKDEIEAILKDWIVDYEHLSDQVMAMMPNFKVIGNSDFVLNLLPYFENKRLENKFLGYAIGEVNYEQLLSKKEPYLTIEIEKLSLGDRIIFSYIDGKVYQEVIQLLKDASLSLGKLQGKMTIWLYTWLVQKAKDSE